MLDNGHEASPKQRSRLSDYKAAVKTDATKNGAWFLWRVCDAVGTLSRSWRKTWTRMVYGKKSGKKSRTGWKWTSI